MYRHEMTQHNIDEILGPNMQPKQVIFSMCECIDVWTLILRYQIPIEENKAILFYPLIESGVAKKRAFSRDSKAFPE